ncbi:hypothetical protein RHMOL_Rhmol03G0139400 [Rhododendron molle]|uniref:Uncharacterized protein n=1 Tax=Rhododendron molle TaxID=49168 RepID=A0ACC0PFA3_RHOML|nr:hypothetical protein RHMOL_Rhmol03G0139400 [Rhododendron molle]
MIRTYSYSIGSRDFHNTSIEIFTLLEKVMLVIVFPSYLNLFMKETRELLIQPSTSKVSWWGMLLLMITMITLAHLSTGGHMV